jgi:hypothetical protein
LGTIEELNEEQDYDKEDVWEVPLPQNLLQPHALEAPPGLESHEEAKQSKPLEYKTKKSTSDVWKVQLYNLPGTVSTRPMMRAMLQEVDIWKDVVNLSMQSGEATVNFGTPDSVEKCIRQFHGRTCLMSGLPIVAVHVPKTVGKEAKSERGKKKVATRNVGKGRDRRRNTTEQSENTMTACEINHMRACLGQTMNWLAYSHQAVQEEWHNAHAFSWADPSAHEMASQSPELAAYRSQSKASHDRDWTQVYADPDRVPDVASGA